MPKKRNKIHYSIKFIICTGVLITIFYILYFLIPSPTSKIKISRKKCIRCLIGCSIKCIDECLCDSIAVHCFILLSVYAVNTYVL